MVRAVDALNGGVRGDADLHRPAWRKFRQAVEQEPHRSLDDRTGRLSGPGLDRGQDGFEGCTAQFGGLGCTCVGRQAKHGALLVQDSRGERCSRHRN